MITEISKYYLEGWSVCVPKFAIKLVLLVGVATGSH